LTSACLLGDLVRYDGQGKLLSDGRISRWQDERRLVRVCPEVAGGLPVPRPPGELTGGDGYSLLAGATSVRTRDGLNLDPHFIAGARAALRTVKSEQIKLALLKSNSPSCGNTYIYDGSFTGKLISGAGVTAALLMQNGIEVYNEHQLDTLEQRIVQLDAEQAH